MAGLSLADDDPRGVELAERAWNNYYDGTFAWMEDMWSGTNAGGHNDWGYAWGRWQINALSIMIAGQYAFADATYPEMLGDYFWRGLMQPVYWSSPGSNFGRGQIAALTATENYLTKKGSLSWFPLGTTFHPGTMSDWAIYWYRNYGLHDSYTGTTGIQAADFLAPYYSESNTGSDWKTAADPWQFNTETTYGPDRAQSYLFSRSDWSSNASFVMAGLGFYEVRDHNVDQSIVTAPGNYLVHKGSKLLLGGNNAAGTGAGSSANQPWFNITAADGKNLKSMSVPWWSSPAVAYGDGGPKAVLDRQKGTPDYVYARGNFSQAFQTSVGVVRSLRSVTHLKGAKEYLVVFDDHAASHADSDVYELVLFYCGRPGFELHLRFHKERGRVQEALGQCGNGKHGTSVPLYFSSGRDHHGNLFSKDIDVLGQHGRRPDDRCAPIVVGDIRRDA